MTKLENICGHSAKQSDINFRVYQLFRDRESRIIAGRIQYNRQKLRLFGKSMMIVAPVMFSLSYLVRGFYFLEYQIDIVNPRLSYYMQNRMK